MAHNEIDSKIEERMNSFSQTIEKNAGFFLDEDGDFCKLEDQKTIRLSNFVFRPVEVIMKVSESGIAEDYKYVFEGILKNEKILKPIEVLKSDLKNRTWIKNWDSFCRIYPNEKQNYYLLLDFILQSERDIPKRIEYDTIGWHQIENKWFFLHSGGVIGRTQNINVSTSNTQFFFKKNDALSPKESFLESLNMLDICDHKLTYSLLSFLLASIVTTPLLNSKELSPNYLLWIVGQTGYGKTTFSTFFTNIYNKNNLARPEAHKTQIILPGINEHKDCVFVIDDFGTSKTKQNENNVIDKIEDIVRKMTDRQLSINKISDGMVLITGEKFLQPNEKNKSSINRIIRVKMDNLFNREDQNTYDALKVEKYDKYKNKRVLPTSIVNYLQWLSEKLNSTFIDDYKKNFEYLRKELGEKYNPPGRFPDAFAHQIIAFNLYISYGIEHGFLTSEEAEKKCVYAKQLFGELLEDQGKEIFDSDIERFFNALKELILNGTIKVQFDKPQLNFDSKVYGVVNTEKGQEVLKLDWEVAYNLVSNYLSLTQKDIKLVGNKTLAKRMNEYNLLCFNENGTTKPFKAQNQFSVERCRVINFNTSLIPDVMEAIAVKEKKRQKPIPSFPKHLLK